MQFAYLGDDMISTSVYVARYLMDNKVNQDQAFVDCVKYVLETTALDFDQSVEYVSGILKDVTKLDTVMQIKEVVTRSDLESRAPKTDPMLENTRKIRV